MPEIKNTFLQGKMNLDLDERLIPSGQYREALNVQINTSEGAEAGTVQNIMGNELVSGYIIPANCECVGSIADERTDKIYWFITSTSEDAIVEYSRLTDSTRFVVVDKKLLLGTGEYADLAPFLRFTGSQITGINIIDNFLFWTDGNSEPKKININIDYQEEPQAYLTYQTPARLIINGEPAEILQEEHVTVIKKKPSKAPTVNINSAIDDKSNAIFEKIFPRFCFRYKYSDGEYSAFGPFTDVVFNSEYENLMNSTNAYNVEEPYNRAMLNLIKSIDIYDFIPSDIPGDVVQVDILYKQENSNVVYSIANISNTDEEWFEEGSKQYSDQGTSNNKGKYTVTTENIHAALPSNQLLRPWDNVPRLASSQEIVGNRLVYGNYTQGYSVDKNIEGEDISIGVNANYSLRDIQDFNQGGLRSIKSKRDYQLGVVFGDEYGRETPVFTSKDAGVKLSWADPTLGVNSSNSLMFNASLTSDFPSWVDYYKFYVKQTSGEYYNMIMDKAYVPFSHSDFANRGDHMWISFSSSDRNKIMEEDFLILKKIYKSGAPEQFLLDNKYKILDIKNEAPDAVKYVFDDMGAIANSTYYLAGAGTDEAVAAGVSDSLFEVYAHRIDQTADLIKIEDAAWLEYGGIPITVNSSTRPKNIYISWEANGVYSERYRVSMVTRHGSSDPYTYDLKLSKTITTTDAALAAHESNTNFLNPDLIFRIQKRESRSSEDFSGKFFVKIKSHSDIIESQDQSGDEQIAIVSSQSTYWLSDYHNTTGDFDETSTLSGILNSSTSGTDQGTAYPANSASDATNGILGTEGMLSTPAEWEALINTDDNSVICSKQPRW